MGKHLIIEILLLGFFYALFSFYYLTINPQLWDAGARIMLCYLAFASTGFVVISYYRNKT